ncbi:MAG: hypothetical protein AAF242_08530 [Bacteroidota bacterium]
MKKATLRADAIEKGWMAVLERYSEGISVAVSEGLKASVDYVLNHIEDDDEEEGDIQDIANSFNPPLKRNKASPMTKLITSPQAITLSDSSSADEASSVSLTSKGAEITLQSAVFEDKEKKETPSKSRFSSFSFDVFNSTNIIKEFNIFWSIKNLSQESLKTYKHSLRFVLEFGFEDDFGKVLPGRISEWTVFFEKYCSILDIIGTVPTMTRFLDHLNVNHLGPSSKRNILNYITTCCIFLRDLHYTGQNDSHQHRRHKQILSTS